LVFVQRGRGCAGGQREAGTGGERTKERRSGRAPHRRRDGSVARLRMAATAKMTATRVRGERAQEPGAVGARTWTAWPGAALVGLYALGGKLAPGVHIPGVIDLNHTHLFLRLRAPLDYWNALALVELMAVPVAVALAIDRGRSAPVRLASLASLGLVLVALGL